MALFGGRKSRAKKNNQKKLRGLQKLSKKIDTSKVVSGQQVKFLIQCRAENHKMYGRPYAIYDKFEPNRFEPCIIGTGKVGERIRLDFTIIGGEETIVSWKPIKKIRGIDAVYKSDKHEEQFRFMEVYINGLSYSDWNRAPAIYALFTDVNIGDTYSAEFEITEYDDRRILGKETAATSARWILDKQKTDVYKTGHNYDDSNSKISHWWCVFTATKK
ncbi:MAG: hypothetical protein AAFR81_27465 [Chloroflexota bacterium]